MRDLEECMTDLLAGIRRPSQSPFLRSRRTGNAPSNFRATPLVKDSHKIGNGAVCPINSILSVMKGRQKTK